MALKRVCDKTGKALGPNEGVIVEAKVVHFAPKVAGKAGYVGANALLRVASVDREVYETKLDFASLDDLNWDIVREKLSYPLSLSSEESAKLVDSVNEMVPNV